MKKKTIAILAAAILVLIVGAGLGFGIYNSPANRLSRQLDLGQKYLEETDYEQAKVFFEELITIDPSNARAYLGVAEAYAGLEDYEGAVAVLKEGYKQTGNEDIKVQLEEYEKKIEEKKLEVEQELWLEIQYILETLPYEHLGYWGYLENDNPIYTYSYLKKVYAEKLPQLFAYTKMDISDMLRAIIFEKIHECYLSINDIEKAKEYWTQSREVSLSSMDECDEYGRIIRRSGSESTTVYEYYENSSLVKTATITTPCSSHDGYSDVCRREYEEYDEEGRMIREVVHESCGYDVANASSFPSDFPVEDRVVLEYTYTYGSNSRETLFHSVDANNFNGKTTFSIGGGKDITTYDEVGNVISEKNYDGDGNPIETGE